MTASPPPARSAVVDNFSLVRGGSLYSLQQRLKLAPGDRQRAWKRILIAVSITWLPLFLLSLSNGVLWSNRVQVPFLLDFATNIRLLVTLPLLIYAQLVVDRRTNQAVRHFVDSGLVTDDMLPSYDAVINRTVRLRDSRTAKVTLVILAFGPSMFMSNGAIHAIGASTWQGALTQSGNAGHSTAGFYNLIISFPIYRLLLFRWLWLIFVWAVFLRKATRLPLHCTPCHPDGAGGLGFIGHAQIFFAPIGLAASAMAAGGFGNLIAYGGRSIDSLKYEIIGFCILAFVVIATPLLVVTPTLFHVRERGLLSYHKLGVEYTRAFDRKWIDDKSEALNEAGREPLLGTADLQSLADLNNSVSVVLGMKLVLLDREVLLGLGIPLVLPMLVLLAVATPVDKVIGAVSRLLF
jgi:hypothetical protein